MKIVCCARAADETLPCCMQCETSANAQRRPQGTTKLLTDCVKSRAATRGLQMVTAFMAEANKHA